MGGAACVALVYPSPCCVSSMTATSPSAPCGPPLPHATPPPPSSHTLLPLMPQPLPPPTPQGGGFPGECHWPGPVCGRFRCLRGAGGTIDHTCASAASLRACGPCLASIGWGPQVTVLRCTQVDGLLFLELSDTQLRDSLGVRDASHRYARAPGWHQLAPCNCCTRAPMHGSVVALAMVCGAAPGNASWMQSGTFTPPATPRSSQPLQLWQPLQRPWLRPLPSWPMGASVTAYPL